MSEPLKSRRDAARYIGLSHSFLAQAAVRGDGPPFVKLSANRVGYRVADLDSWIESRVRRSTSERAGN